MFSFGWYAIFCVGRYLPNNKISSFTALYPKLTYLYVVTILTVGHLFAHFPACSLIHSVRDSGIS